MRVLHISPTAFGHAGLFGGGERYPVELARALARMDGVECELLTFGLAEGVEDVDGLVVRVLRARAHLNHHPAHPLAFGLAAAMRNADVVHVHHMRSAPARMAAVLAAVRRTPVVVTDHGLSGGNWFGVLPRLFRGFLNVSRYSSDVLNSPPERTTVIWGGADLHRFHPGTEPRDGVLFVGRLTPHKGVDRLIQALPDGASLTIAGTAGHDRDAPERDYESHLRRLAAGKEVHFVGAATDAELSTLYRRAAVVAVPSVETTCYGKRVPVSELLSLTAIEAMASATPVVASRVGGLPEVVVDGETGHLVSPGDIGGMKAVLSALLRDGAHARAIGAAGRARVADQFTWGECARRCIDAYRAVVR